MILAGRCAFIAARFLRMLSIVPLILPLWNRINRAAQRFTRAMNALTPVPAVGRILRPLRNLLGLPLPTRVALPCSRSGWPWGTPPAEKPA